MKITLNLHTGKHFNYYVFVNFQKAKQMKQNENNLEFDVEKDEYFNADDGK